MSWRQGDVSGTLDITESHISRGKRRDLFNDPISLAIKEATDSDWVMTGWGYAKSSKGSVKIDWTLGPFNQIATWLKRWDEGKLVPPISITIQLDKMAETPVTPKNFKVRRYGKDTQTRLGL